MAIKLLDVGGRRAYPALAFGLQSQEPFSTPGGERLEQNPSIYSWVIRFEPCRGDSMENCNILDMAWETISKVKAKQSTSFIEVFASHKSTE